MAKPDSNETKKKFLSKHLIRVLDQQLEEYARGLSAETFDFLKLNAADCYFLKDLRNMALAIRIFDLFDSEAPLSDHSYIKTKL